MSTPHVPIGHPARRDEHDGRSVSRLWAAFALVGGPAAWFAQLCAGYGLSSWPCFPKDQPYGAASAGYAWMWVALGLVSLAAAAIAIAAALTSWRILQMTRVPASEEGGTLLEADTTRSRFLAMWGLVMGGGFALATAFTAVAFFILPRCGG